MTDAQVQKTVTAIWRIESPKLIAGLTDALCAATHEGLRDHTWVIVEGHNPKNWGLGGKPWPVGDMPPAA